jgi:hypothetical protein
VGFFFWVGWALGVMRLDVCVCVCVCVGGGRKEFGKGVILDVVLSPVASIFSVASTNFLFCVVVSTWIDWAEELHLNSFHVT